MLLGKEKGSANVVRSTNHNRVCWQVIDFFAIQSAELKATGRLRVHTNTVLETLSVLIDVVAEIIVGPIRICENVIGENGII